MYADEIDRASDIADAMNQESIRIASIVKHRTPKVPGFCDYCESSTREDGKPMTAQHLFCSTECRDGDAKEQRLRGFNGKQDA